MNPLTERSTKMSSSKPERRYYLDWLRVLAVVLLLFFHTSLIFNYGPWLVKNDQLSNMLLPFTRFVQQWRLPLLFFVSGASAFFALGRRSGMHYMRGRFKRLFIPLVVGMLVVIPPQSYYLYLSTLPPEIRSSNLADSFFTFLPRFFTGMYAEGKLDWQHLWFVAFLLLFSLITLPLFLYLRTEKGQRRTAWLAACFDNGFTILLLGIPLALIEVTVRERWHGAFDSLNRWETLFFLIFFIYGYLLNTDARFERAIVRTKVTALGLAISATLLIILGVGEDSTLHLILHAFDSWFWVVAILGFGQLYLNKPSRVLRYANELVYPFYIFHQTAIVMIGFHVVQWQVGIAVKFAVISSTALIVSILLCELVKQTNLTRLLFGLNPKKQPSRNRMMQADLKLPQRVE